MNTMTLDEAERRAQQMSGQVWFTLVAPSGKETRVYWEDQWMGAIIIPGKEGIIWKHTLDDTGFTAKDISLEE